MQIKMKLTNKMFHVLKPTSGKLCKITFTNLLPFERCLKLSTQNDKNDQNLSLFLPLLSVLKKILKQTLINRNFPLITGSTTRFIFCRLCTYGFFRDQHSLLFAFKFSLSINNRKSKNQQRTNLQNNLHQLSRVEKR